MVAEKVILEDWFLCGEPLIRIINLVSFEIVNISNIVLTVLPVGSVTIFFGGAIARKLAKNLIVAVMFFLSLIFISFKIPFV